MIRVRHCKDSRLRSPGNNQNNAAVVKTDGSRNNNVNNDNNCVRPAFPESLKPTLRREACAQGGKASDL